MKYEAYVDPAGGNWIRFTEGSIADIVWRPVDMEFDETDQLSFGVELFDGPGISSVTEENTAEFMEAVSTMISDTLAAEAAELELLAEAAEAEEKAKKVKSPLEKQMDAADNLHKITADMIDEDAQEDLDTISSVLGGLKNV